MGHPVKKPLDSRFIVNVNSRSRERDIEFSRTKFRWVKSEIAASSEGAYTR